MPISVLLDGENHTVVSFLGMSKDDLLVVFDEKGGRILFCDPLMASVG
jgi:hypothetical protein